METSYLVRSSPYSLVLGQGLGEKYFITQDDGVLASFKIKFRTSWGVARINNNGHDQKAYMLRYIEERYNWLNKVAFGGLLRKPEFEVSTHKTALGMWTPGLRRLQISRFLFATENQDTLLGTLLHEMAHQYETEHSPRPFDEDGHGETWQLIMIALGASTRATCSTRLKMYRKENSVQKKSSDSFEITF